MSGGYFNYNQCLITEIADIIALEIARALLPKPQKVHEDYWTIDEHDCPLGHHNYPYYADVLELNEETIGTMKQAYLQIRKAYVLPNGWIGCYQEMMVKMICNHASRMNWMKSSRNLTIKPGHAPLMG